MKKIYIYALSAVAAIGTLAVSCQGGGSSITPNASLKNDIDTVSYAYGVQMAQSGLNQYLTQLGVMEDTALFAATQRQLISSEADAAKKATLEQQLKSKLDSISKANDKNMVQFMKGLNESFGTSGKDKDAYFNGIQLGGQLKQMSESFEKQVLVDASLNKSAFLAGLTSALKNEKVLIENSQELVQSRAMANQEKAMKKQEEELRTQHADKLEAGQKFLEENKAKDGVVTLPSGLQYKIVKEGKGAKPSASDRVKVNYKGTLTNGTTFDSNEGREPVALGVGQVIKGWTEALQLMPVGSKWTLYIPYDLAYGAQGSGQIPPFSTLIFDVELVGIDK